MIFIMRSLVRFLTIPSSWVRIEMSSFHPCKEWLWNFHPCSETGYGIPLDRWERAQGGTLWVTSRLLMKLKVEGRNVQADKPFGIGASRDSQEPCMVMMHIRVSRDSQEPCMVMMCFHFDVYHLWSWIMTCCMHILYIFCHETGKNGWIEWHLIYHFGSACVVDWPLKKVWWWVG
jgi:hypothetical protein